MRRGRTQARENTLPLTQGSWSNGATNCPNRYFRDKGAELARSGPPRRQQAAALQKVPQRAQNFDSHFQVTLGFERAGSALNDVEFVFFAGH